MSSRSSKSGRLLAASLVGAAVLAGTTVPTQAAPAPRDAATVLASMSLPQRVGQLFMVGSPATSVDARMRRQIGRFHVGNVILTGRSYSGTRTPARVAAALQSQTTDAATDGVRLFVATDQEGGLVQVLQGPGISRIPTALRQGRFSVTRLRSAAGQWARELRAAGVNMNLAPVMDTVPSPAAAQDNLPIGFFDREYGYTTLRVSRHGSAFARGMAANKVVPVAKHFPGLGRVHANPDTSTGVTDRVTRRGDAYLQPFRAAIDAGVPVVMMSSAYYSRMDRSRPAAFSSFVVGTVLRGDLGFRGVVISDDLGNARQVSPWRPGARAVKFVRAGGDVVLTVNPDTVAAMYGAVLARARTHPAFRAKVDHAALLVLRLKQAHGLLG